MQTGNKQAFVEEWYYVTSQGSPFIIQAREREFAGLERSTRISTRLRAFIDGQFWGRGHRAPNVTRE